MLKLCSNTLLNTISQLGLVFYLILWIRNLITLLRSVLVRHSKMYLIFGVTVKTLIQSSVSFSILNLRIADAVLFYSQVTKFIPTHTWTISNCLLLISFTCKQTWHRVKQQLLPTFCSVLGLLCAYRLSSGTHKLALCCSSANIKEVNGTSSTAGHLAKYDLHILVIFVVRRNTTAIITIR